MEDKNLNPVYKSICDFLYEEEANIDRKKIISIGTLICLATILMASDIMAKHSSHSSHRSHTSHSSGAYHRSHVSHTSHNSSQNGHSSHASAGSHSNHASGHSNHSSSFNPSDHTSHSSGYVSHTSHVSSYNAGRVTHSNSGIADVDSMQTPQESIPVDEMVDIRIPLTPPDSPSMNGGK